MYEKFWKENLEKAKTIHNEVKGICPYHDDHEPSFYGNIETGQFYCQACQKSGNAFRFAKNQNIPYAKVPGYEKKNYSNFKQKKSIAAIYNYHDEKGNLYYQAIRYENPKDFRFRQPDGNGGWNYHLKGKKRILYYLPNVIHAKEVIIVEGEKDADLLHDAGYIATTNPSGAGKWKGNYNPYFKEKNVIIIPDNDEPGKEHAKEIIKNLLKITKTIKLVLLPVGHKEDVSDYLQNHSLKELEEQIRNAPVIRDLNYASILICNLNKLHLTDAGNAEAINKLYGNRLRFDHVRKKFLIFEKQKHKWQIDETGEVERIALNTTRERQRAAVDIEDKENREKAIKWTFKSECNYQTQATLKILTTLKPIATTIQEFDKKPWQLGCKNGIVNLKTGELRPGAPEDHISLSTNIQYEKSTKAPRWERFLDEVFSGDETLIQFVQRAFGYSLAGVTNEQIFFILIGSGENGKSIFLTVLRNILGDYGANTAFATFEWSKYDNAKISNDIAALAGKRVVTASEMKENTYLNEGRIKALTGEDPITCRFLYQENFTYIPAYKVWLAVNHRPKITDTSHAFWRRPKVIPFERKFTGKERDNQLGEKLRAEYPGILNWAVQGCLDWQKNGIGEPEKVTEAIKSYRDEMDIVRQFLKEETISGENFRVEAKELYKEYEKWCHDNGEKVMSGTMFGRKIAEIGFSKRPFGESRRIHYFNLGLTVRADKLEK